MFRIRLKLQQFMFSLSPAREGWELSTFPFCLICAFSTQEKQGGWGEAQGPGKRIVKMTACSLEKEIQSRSARTGGCPCGLGTTGSGEARGRVSEGEVCCGYRAYLQHCALELESWKGHLQMFMKMLQRWEVEAWWLPGVERLLCSPHQELCSVQC